MKIKRDVRIYLDANAVIEANRAGIWKQLLGHFVNLSTVKTVWIELGSGDAGSPDYVRVDVEQLADKLELYDVDDRQRIALQFELNNQIALDAGELDLLAHIHSETTEVFYVCSPDRAAVRASKVLGILDRVISLEEIAESAGLRKTNLQKHFGKRWLDQFKTQLNMQGL